MGSEQVLLAYAGADLLVIYGTNFPSRPQPSPSFSPATRAPGSSAQKFRGCTCEPMQKIILQFLFPQFFKLFKRVVQLYLCNL